MVSTTGVYRDQSNGSKILRLLALAFLIRLAAAWNVNKTTSDPASEFHRVFNEDFNLWGWAVLLIILVAASEYDSTSDLALAFAMLITLMVAMNYGPKAFETINKIIQFNAPATPPPDGAQTPAH